MTFHPGDLADTFDPACHPPLLKQPEHPLWPDIRKAISTVFDPDMEINVYEMGLIFDVNITDTKAGADVKINMGLSSPTCFVAGELPMWIEGSVGVVPGVANTEVNVVYNRLWTRDHMADTARIALNLF